MSPARMPGTLLAHTGRADSTAANSHASIHLAGCDCLRERNQEIGIIVTGIQIVGAEVHHLVPNRFKFGHEVFFETESTMIGSDANPHAISLSSSSVRFPAAVLSS